MGFEWTFWRCYQMTVFFAAIYAFSNILAIRLPAGKKRVLCTILAVFSFVEMVYFLLFVLELS